MLRLLVIQGAGMKGEGGKDGKPTLGPAQSAAVRSSSSSFGRGQLVLVVFSGRSANGAFRVQES